MRFFEDSRVVMLSFSLIPVAICLLINAAQTLAQTIVLQAEDGVLKGVKAYKAVPGCSGTGFVSGFSAEGDSVTVRLQVSTTALYDLDVAYRSRRGEKEAFLQLNGATLNEITLTSTTWANVSAGQIQLTAGYNTIGIQNHRRRPGKRGSYDIDAFYLSPTPLPPPQTIALQAENGVLDGVAVDTSMPGYSGTGFVSGFDTGSDSVTVNLTVPNTALYDLTFAYSAPYGQKNTYVILNGATSGEVTLSSTTWANVSAGRVLLNAGSNTIGILSNWGWYNIDAFYLDLAPPRPPHQATGPPVNPNASPEARSMLKYIQRSYANSSALISGQQAGRYLSGDLTTDSISWIQANLGKSPAIGGFDFMDYSPSRVEFGTVSNDTEQAMAWDQIGGMVFLLWHWNAPTNLINSEEWPWWRGFYTQATTFNLTAALAEGPDGPNYQLILRDIDAIAVQLQRLQSANIPTVFRFLHEADGRWFWWGAHGPAAAIELYRIGVDRWTNHHGLNNIIWAWNSVDPAWYPGSDVVDILTYDSYPATGDHGPISGKFNDLVKLGNDQKVVALGEVGSIPDPSLLVAYNTNWAYFMTWTGFISDGVSNPISFLQKVYNDPNVITLQSLGNFKYLK